MALSFHLSMDLFVPRNEGCVKGELRVSGFSSLWCSECQRSSLVDLSQQQRFSLTVVGL